MKVLHIDDYAFGGLAEVLMHEIVRRLTARGVRAEIFTADEIVNLRRHPFRRIDSLRCRCALRLRLDEFEPDVVHLHTFHRELSPGILATLRRWRRRHSCRVVMTVHDYHLICPESHLLRFKYGEALPADPQRLKRLLHVALHTWDRRGHLYGLPAVLQHLWNYRVWRRRRQIDLLLCPSRSALELLRSFRRICLPHPPLSVERPVEGGRPRAGDPRFVFVGDLEPQGGLEPFLISLPAGFRGTIELIGDGSLRRRCEAICSQRGLGGRVVFSGALPWSETIDRVSRAHVLVDPAAAARPDPVVVVAALALGTNVLVSTAGAPAETVEEAGVGFVFAQDRPGDLDRVLREIDQRHDEGTLNDFDVSSFLAARDEAAFMRGLLRAYEAEGTDVV